MNYTRVLIRMKRWAQNPPPMRKVIFVFSIIAACLALFAFEFFIGWPDFLTVEKLRP